MLPAAAFTLDPSRHNRDVPLPRARSIGAVLLVAGVISMVFVPAGPLAQCGVWAFESAAQTYLLLIAIVTSGVALLVKLPKCSAAAPALALGAALPLLGASLAAWSGFIRGGCTSSDPLAVMLVIETAGALAVAGCSTWLLYARDELEPWYGSRGVVISAMVGALVIVVGIGADLASLAYQNGEVDGAFFVSGPLVWGAVIAVCGWLRRTPAIALVMCSAVQVVWLLLR